MAIKGIFTSDAGPAGDRSKDFASLVLKAKIGANAPLLALSSGMKTVDTDSTRHTWYEQYADTGRVSITNAAAVGNSFVFADASVVTANQVYMVEETQERIIILSITGDTATVQRGVNGSTIVAIDGSGTPVMLQRIGTVFPEDSQAPEPIVSFGASRENYNQIFRNAWGASRTAQQVGSNLTSDRIGENRMVASQYHSEDIERSFWWGLGGVTRTGNKRLSMMHGLLAMMKTNVTVAGVTSAYTDFRDHMQDLTRWSVEGKPQERITFCGPTVLNVVNDIARAESAFQSTENTTMYGMNVTKLRTNHGDFTFIEHPMLKANPSLSGDMYTIHPGTIEIRYMQRTVADSNAKTPGQDGDKGVLTTECSIIMGAERTSGRIEGVTAAA